MTTRAPFRYFRLREIAFVPLLWMAALPSASAFDLAGRQVDPQRPPLGLKTYLDLGVMADEILIVRADSGADKAEATGTACPLVRLKMPAVAKEFEVAFGLGGTPAPDGRMPFCAPNVLWGSHSKDGGRTWGPARFIAALAQDGTAISGLNVTRLPAKKLEISFLNGCGRRVRLVWRPDNVRSFATAEDIRRAPEGRFVLKSAARDEENPWRMRDDVCVGGDLVFSEKAMPPEYGFDADTGLLKHRAIAARVVHTAQSPEGTLYETRIARVPCGDFLIFIPDGMHGNTKNPTGNALRAYRSADEGRTWQGEGLPFGEGRHFGVLPFAARMGDTERLFVFESHREAEMDGRLFTRAFGGRHSDDGGRTFSEKEIFRMKDGRPFGGVGVIPISQSETKNGTLLVGFHHAKILRATRDQVAKSYAWEVTGPAETQSTDLFDPTLASMNELQVVSDAKTGLSQAFARTCGGRIWRMEGSNDGRAWGAPAPTPLTHPDAPPMFCRLSDGETLLALHHNRAVLRTVCEPMHSQWYAMPMPGKEQIARAERYPQSMNDWVSRSEIWCSLSKDGGKTWGEPRFLFANALQETLEDPNPNYQLSYVDAFAKDGVIHMVVPQRWARVLYLRLNESDLARIPTREAVRKTVSQP